MKFCSNYFKQKNTKQGMALSTAMVIAIVLTLLVTMMVSMATLNISTTQVTVDQREAYIQAKSALEFAEAYYTKNTSKIPKAASAAEATALIVFNDYEIASGADIYVTKADGTPPVSDADIQDLKDDAKSTYVEVLNNGKVLQFTAYCKYGDGDMYSLSKEFEFANNSAIRGNQWKGNISYTVSNDTRYLRIHVRTSPAFIEEPYLYTWANNVNDDTSGTANGTSSIVNKLLGSTQYPSRNFPANGKWDGDNGPTTPMEYEGNGWYVMEIQFSADEHINTVNAVVTRKGAHRTGAGASFDSQSWELFGIPVPNETGSENGADVYITLNKDKLQDAIDLSGSPVGDLNHAFHGIHNFAQLSSEYYSVYTKQTLGIIHVRNAKEYTDTGSSTGDYEGYGWYRFTSNNLNDTVDGIAYNEGKDITPINTKSQEVIKELFICKREDGSIIDVCGTEEDANKCFVDYGDKKAGDYVTVNVRSNKQPVDQAVSNTKITYGYTWIESDTDMPTPDGPTSDTDTEAVATDIGFDADSEPTVGVLSLPKSNIQGSGAALDIQSSGTHIVGGSTIYFDTSAVDWWENDSAKTLFVWWNNDESDKKCVQVNSEGAGKGSVTFPDDTDISNIILLRVADTAEYSDITNIGDWVNNVTVHNQSNTTAYSDGNNLIKFDNGDEKSLSSVTSDEYPPIGGGDTDTETDTDTSVGYAVAGWFNNWARPEGSTADDNAYEYADDMTFIGSNQYKLEVNGVAGGQEIRFKVIEKPEGATGAIDWNRSFGSGSGDYVYNVPGDVLTNYKVTILFTVNGNKIDVTCVETHSVGDYFLVGDFNNWADNHSFDRAQSFPMTEEGVDINGNTYYTFSIGVMAAGDHEVKVICDQSSQPDDGTGKTIDYAQSWGRADDDGVTMGADKDAFKFTLTETSTVVVTFTVDSTDITKSRITYKATKYDIPQGDLKKVAFFNDQLVNANNNSEKSNFTTPWEHVYVSYIVNSVPACIEVTHTTGDNKFFWATVPDNADFIYFSNGDPATQKGKPGYEYTENINNSEFKSVSNPVFFPISDSNTADGKKWTFGNTEKFRLWTNVVQSGTDTVDMVWAGTNKISYYDVPITKLLNILVDGDSGNYIFSSKVWSSSHPYNYAGKDYVFNKSQYVTYQNERYYYVPRQGGGESVLIVNEGSGGKGAHMQENEFSAASDNWNGFDGTMQNRAGGTFTSTGEYYNSTASNPQTTNGFLDYDGYTPNWYTCKIKTSSIYDIKKIEGVESAATTININSSTLSTVKSGAYSNQPLYIYKDGGNTEVYTYDIDTGRVDTSADGKVSVYFNKPSGWSGNVKCRAYGINGAPFDGGIGLDGDVGGSDPKYYKFTFDEGEYVYFVFYDGSESFDTTTKKTGVLYLTGEEDNHEYKILADGQTNEFSFYLHPKTQALYAFQEARSAYFGSGINISYTYDKTNKKYVSSGFKYMTALEGIMHDAENYKNNGSGGKWTSGGSASYSELAKAATAFTEAVTKARIYIASDPNDSAADPNYYFPEFNYRDEIVSYPEVWVNELKDLYNDAMDVYNDTGKQNAATLQDYADRLTFLINNPSYIIINPNAVTVIIDDKTDADGNGGWGKSNMHIYAQNTSGGVWSSCGYPVLDTSQSSDGFYAYVFMKKSDENTFAILRGSKTEPDDDDKLANLAAGKRYFFHTATGEWEEDNTPPSITVTVNKIKQGERSAGWAKNETPVLGKAFELYFNFDTTVEYSGGSYTIYAGAYKIDSSYVGWDTDLISGGSEKRGIDLFTDSAKDFFTDSESYGMSSAVPYEVWSSNKASAGDVDVMCESIASSPLTLSAEGRRVNFRFKNEKGNDKLYVDAPVRLKGEDTVTIAANKIDLSHLSGSDSFIVDCKSVTFLTDTKITTKDGSTYEVTHGKWVFVTGAGSAEIDLNDKSWMDRYQQISETGTTLGKGGTYVSKNN